MEDQVEEIQKNANNARIARFDKGVADNLESVKKSYGSDGSIALDVIIFLSHQLKFDLFGYTTFTLNQFCSLTGRNRRELSSRHSYLIGPNARKPEVLDNYEFCSVIDYVLYQMTKTNIMFSKTIRYTENNRVFEINGLQVIKHVKIHTDTTEKNTKIYQVRLSDDFLSGFMSRYYTFNVSGYPKIGKGKGGEGRKSLYLLFNKVMHMKKESSEEVKTSWYSVDYLCKVANLNYDKSQEQKRNLTKVLETLIEKGGLEISYSYVLEKNAETSNKKGYWVKVVFDNNSCIQKGESKGDHKFMISMFNKLKTYFNTIHAPKNYNFKDVEADPFQRWLTNSLADRDVKIEIYMESYHKSYNKRLSRSDAEVLMFQTKFPLFND